MTPAVAHVGFGQVRHVRLRPRRHAFAYDTCFLMLPMRQLGNPVACGGLPVNRPGPVAFYDSDHGDGRPPDNGGALGWIDETLRDAGITDATGEIWLHTLPRMWGYTFKPVSFWYCHRPDGHLRAVLAEVNNTFGERHCYLLDQPRYGVHSIAAKCFHVSPFCRPEGLYRFRFMRCAANPATGQVARTVVRVEHDDDNGPLIQTSVSGTLHAINPALLRRMVWRYPALTLMVMVRIHWQALQLWAKRTQLHGKPPAPKQFVTR